MNEESNFTFLPNSDRRRSVTWFADEARPSPSSSSSPFLIRPSRFAISFGSLGNSAARLTLPSSQRNAPNHLVTRIILAHIQKADKKHAGGHWSPPAMQELLRSSCRAP